MSKASESGQHGRGLYRQQYRGPGGNTVITVMDRYGRRLAFVSIPDRANYNGVTRCLRMLLGELDPRPAMEIVGGEPLEEVGGGADE